MNLSKDRRLSALCLLNKKYSTELDRSKDKRWRVWHKLISVKAELSDLDDEINQIETKIRSAMSQGQSVSVDTYHLAADFLKRKSTIRMNKDRQRHYAEKQIDEMSEKLQQQMLQIRAVDKIYRRRLRAIQFEFEANQLRDMDEIWLQRQGKTSD